MATTTKLNLSIFTNNAPDWAHVLSTCSKLFSAISILPASLNAAGLTHLPPQLITLSMWGIGGGVLVSLICQTFGVVDENGKAVTPSTAQLATKAPAQP